MDNKALYNMTYGLFLLTARENGVDNGCIINTAIQVSSSPLRISVAVIKTNKTHDMILNTGKFNVSAISTNADFALFQRFGMQSGRTVNKFDGFSDVARSSNGLYYLTKACNAYYSAKVFLRLDLGSHTLFVADLEDAQVVSEEASCTYNYYQSDIKPKPQATKTPEQTEKKKVWVCKICGYVYEGEEMPDDYICPLCKHPKEDFELREI